MWCALCWLIFSPPVEDVVRNGKQPSGQAQTLVFSEELRFGGGDGEDDYLWTYGSGVSPDFRGFMYVADPRANKVFEFNPDGELTRTIAREGNGPGEFQRLSFFTVLKDGSAVGFERLEGLEARFHHFDKQMKFKKMVAPREHGLILEIVQLAPRGDRIAAFYVTRDMDARVMRHEVSILDNQLRVQKRLNTGPRPLFDVSKFDQPGYWVDRIGGNVKLFLSGMGVVAFCDDGSCYTALNSRYEITHWNADLKTKKRTITREYKPIAQSPENLEAMVELFTEDMLANPRIAKVVTPPVLARAIEVADPSPAKNPIYAMMVMEDGTLLVVHEVDLVSRKNRADIFSAQGVYRGWVSMNNHALVKPIGGGYLPAMVFRNGKAYTMEVNDDGDMQVVRYGYAWAKP